MKEMSILNRGRNTKQYKKVEETDKLESYYRVRMLLENATGEDVLEMGIGCGFVTEALCKNFKYVVAMDGSKEIIKQVSKKLGQIDNVTLIHSLFEDYSPDRTFDDIVMFNILEHVQHPVDILKRAKGWLAPGGNIHIIVPNALSLHRRLGRAMGLNGDERALSAVDTSWAHRRVYTAETLMEDITTSGLVIEKLEGLLIKPLSSYQMKTWDNTIFDGLYQLGKELPELCSGIYAKVLRGD